MILLTQLFIINIQIRKAEGSCTMLEVWGLSQKTLVIINNYWLLPLSTIFFFAVFYYSLIIISLFFPILSISFCYSHPSCQPIYVIHSLSPHTLLTSFSFFLITLITSYHLQTSPVFINSIYNSFIFIYILSLLQPHPYNSLSYSISLITFSPYHSISFNTLIISFLFSKSFFSMTKSLSSISYSLLYLCIISIFPFHLFISYI